MVDEETLYNATADLVIANIRRYVLAYVPTCENPVAAACEGAAAPMFFTLVNYPALKCQACESLML